jgi:hypothetical protein
MIDLGGVLRSNHSVSKVWGRNTFYSWQSLVKVLLLLHVRISSHDFLAAHIDVVTRALPRRDIALGDAKAYLHTQGEHQ